MGWNNDCPCTRECPTRTPGCSCDKYKAWKDKREAEKKAAHLRSERFSLTHACQHRIWSNTKRDGSGAKKKFSQ